MTLAALNSRHGKKRCVDGAAAVPTADTKVMTDKMRPGLVASALITEDLHRLQKVTAMGATHAANVAAALTQPAALSRAPGPSPDCCYYYEI